MNTAIGAASVAPASRIDAAAAYPSVMAALAGTVETPTPEQWQLDTECTGWTVRHLAARVLGAQQDLLSVPTVLLRRFRGRRRYPPLSLLDAASQVQVDDHAGLEKAQLCQAYRANIPRVAARVVRGVPDPPSSLS